MNTLSTTTSLLTHSFVWALLYSLWQGLLIYGTLYMLLKAMPNVNARIKYYLSFGSFTALSLWFADTWATQYQKLKGTTVYITRSGIDNGISTTYSVKTIPADPVIQSNIIHHFLPRLEQYFPFIITLYAIGLVFMLFRFTVNIWQVKALRKQGIIYPDIQLSLLLEQLQNKFEISRRVQLFISSRVNVPMMLGVIKPIILLPVATINNLSAEQVEAILMHELAHIKRHDYLLNILQTVIETILFFNPFIWLISSVIRNEREHCCDDLVILRSANPLTYVKALAILENNRLNNNDLVLAATGRKKQLFKRIKRIMEMKKNNINYSQLAIIVVAILAITISVTMFTFTPSFAQKPKKDDADTTMTAKKKSVYKYKSVTVDKNGKRTETVKESDKPIKGDAKDDDDNVNLNISINDGDDDKGTGGSDAPHARAYSYSYSNNNNCDLDLVIKDIALATKDVIGAAVASIDFKELEKEMENAQKDIDNVDWDEVKAEIRKSMAEVDKELNDAKLHKEISIEVKKGLEESKEALKKAEIELKKNRQVMINARANAGKSRAYSYGSNNNDEDSYSSSNDFESMLDKMEKDGLIDRSKNYKVVKEDDELYINGKQQPADVYNRYKRYLSGNNISIKGHKGSLSISVNN